MNLWLVEGFAIRSSAVRFHRESFLLVSSHNIQRVLLMQGRHNLYFKLHVYGLINLHRRPYAAADCAPMRQLLIRW